MSITVSTEILEVTSLFRADDRKSETNQKKITGMAKNIFTNIKRIFISRYVTNSLKAARYVY